MTIWQLPVSVDSTEVRRYLGYGRRRRPRQDIAERLETIVDEAAALIEPVGACRLVGHQPLSAMEIDELEAYVAACTIGPRLEEESARLSKEGDLLGALLLDAFGSAAAEAAADSLNERICEEARSKRRHLKRRVSPGYGKWDVSHQEELLSLLPIDRLQMRLTPGMMMVPRKSVSFLAALTETPNRSPGGCRTCGRRDCSYRDQEPRGDTDD